VALVSMGRLQITLVGSVVGAEQLTVRLLLLKLS
jgi:hypothetical protein